MFAFLFGTGVVGLLSCAGTITFIYLCHKFPGKDN